MVNNGIVLLLKTLLKSNNLQKLFHTLEDGFLNFSCDQKSSYYEKKLQIFFFYSRCFVQPSFKIASILRAVLRDEMIAWNKKNGANVGATNTNSGSSVTTNAEMAATNNAEQENRDKELIISLVTKAVQLITQRLTSLSSFDGVDSKVGTLVATAKSHDNLCRMDPAWHPWL